MGNRYLTTNEAVNALKSGKKLKGYTDTDYCYYDTEYANPFRYVGVNGINNPMNLIWENKKYEWEIFEEPVYEWQWLYFDEDVYDTTGFMTDEEFQQETWEEYTNFQKIEQSKRERK